MNIFVQASCRGKGLKEEKCVCARTEMELQVSNFQRVTAAVLRETAAEIGDRVDKFVGDVQQKLAEVAHA